MKIETNRHVTIDYALTLDSGELVDSSGPGAPLEFIFGAGRIITGLEKAIAGMETGQKAKVVVEPEEGYGRVKPELLREIPRKHFPPELDILPGMGFEAEGPHGRVRFRVKSIDGETVVADFNHPLAGERLYFEITVNGVREATPEELENLSAACDKEGCDPGGCGGGCCG